MTDSIIGKTFALTKCKAWIVNDNNQPAFISGLYMVEDRVIADRSCGQWEGGYLVFPAASAGMDDAPLYFVNGERFLEQTDPHSYGRLIVQERETDWISEQFDRDRELDEFESLFGHGEIDPAF